MPPAPEQHNEKLIKFVSEIKENPRIRSSRAGMELLGEPCGATMGRNIFFNEENEAGSAACVGRVRGICARVRGIAGRVSGMCGHIPVTLPNMPVTLPDIPVQVSQLGAKMWSRRRTWSLSWGTWRALGSILVTCCWILGAIFPKWAKTKKTTTVHHFRWFFLYPGALLERMLACLGAMLGHLGASLEQLGDKMWPESAKMS